MKKAIKKTCVVLLLFALLVSQVAASYSETGTLNEGTSAIAAAERYLSNWAYNSYMYADKNLTLKNPNGATTNLGTVTNTTSISKVYTPTVAAHPNDLYTVTVTAVSADGVTTSSTWTFRTY